MNDPQYVEAARALATRVMQFDLQSDRQRATQMYRMCTGRFPDEVKTGELVQLFQDELARYAADQESARRFLKGLTESEHAGDLDVSRRAAWTIVANLLLNLDEVITKN